MLQKYSYSASGIHNHLSTLDSTAKWSKNGITLCHCSKVMASRTSKSLLSSLKSRLYFLIILKPKLDFFNSVGLSPLDLQTIVGVDPQFLTYSLQNQIIPSYQHLKSILHTTENVNFSMRRSPRLLCCKSQRNLAQNIDAMRERGVPDGGILHLLKAQPRTMISQPDKFKEIVLKIKNMGFDPNTSQILAAIRTLAGLQRSIWEKKNVIYRKWGWSDEDIITAFKKAPGCMAASGKKIEMAMDFLINKMGFSSSDVGECPYVINYSLEKWTFPRCLVYQFLFSKGFIEKKRLAYVISVKKQHFVKVFLIPYSAEFLELLTIYEPKKVVAS